MWPRRINIDESNWIQTRDECKIKELYMEEPMIWVNKDQYEIVKGTENSRMRNSVAENLPTWIPAQYIANYFGYSRSGITKAVHHFKGPYMWATEFENCHSTWKYTEMPIWVDGVEYECSESYYQTHKPHYSDMSQNARDKRMIIMKKGVWEKFIHAENSDDLLNLLVSTYPHNLVAVKRDAFWGFDPEHGGENQLANILMEIRSEAIEVMQRQLRYDWNIDKLWSSYNKENLPSGWVLSEHKSYLLCEGSTAKHTKCLTMDPNHKYLDLVLQRREPTNIENEPGYFNITNLAEGFGYAESGYKTAFKLAKQQQLPPNFALLCKTRVQSPEVETFMQFTKKYKKCYINVVNSIGFAFDAKSQPDYIYFVQGKRMHEFDSNLKNMFRVMFAAYVESGCKMLVLAQIGAGAFSSLFPGCSHDDPTEYLTKHYYPCLEIVWRELKIAPTIILMNENPKLPSIHMLKLACPNATILQCEKFPAVVTQHVRLDKITKEISLHKYTDSRPDTYRTDCHELSDALFVNAWDPHSVVGNGNYNDYSLDGFIGRYTDMAPMSFQPTNPNIPIVDAKTILG